MLEQLAASELLPEHSSLDKTKEETGEKIYKAEKTSEKLMILTEKTKIWKSSSKMLSIMHGRNLKEQRLIFSR